VAYTLCSRDAHADHVIMFIYYFCWSAFTTQYGRLSQQQQLFNCFFSGGILSCY